MLRKIQCTGILMIGSLCLVALSIHQFPLDWISPPFFVNTSTSLPPGFYHMTRKMNLSRGDILRTCLPYMLNRVAVQHEYLHRGNCPGGSNRIGKPVIALAGDTVTVSEKITEVTGYRAFTAPVHTYDRTGRILPNAIGIHVLQSGECFFLSTHNHLSYDSRYYGPVPCGIPPYHVLTVYGSKASKRPDSPLSR